MVGKVRGAGGCDGDGGHTIALGGLTPRRYYVLLTMLSSDYRHPDAPVLDFDVTPDGPLFGTLMPAHTYTPQLACVLHTCIHMCDSARTYTHTHARTHARAHARHATQVRSSS